MRSSLNLDFHSSSDRRSLAAAQTHSVEADAAAKPASSGRDSSLGSHGRFVPAAALWLRGACDLEDFQHQACAGSGIG